MEKQEIKRKIKDDLKKYYSKADLSRTIYGRICLRIERFLIALQIIVTIGGAIAAMLIFADIGKWTIIAGFLSGMVFIAGISIQSFKLNEKVLERKIAIKEYGIWMKRVQTFINFEIDEMADEESMIIWKSIIESYTKLMSETPLIQDRDFIIGKKRHKEKVAISKYLDEMPFKSIREIKKILSEK